MRREWMDWGLLVLGQGGGGGSGVLTAESKGVGERARGYGVGGRGEVVARLRRWGDGRGLEGGGGWVVAGGSGGAEEDVDSVSGWGSLRVLRGKVRDATR
ncbi:hypothetical protein CesoFtcFv8_025032 [Champsocephalus esox]|uniref:Uncharacterized protein n=1 Tax=Champsocephalus esox TaxID=159716 RepID=A0AAN8GEC9_9TELE|nr:hypothetical protein CesoFtcFv8_025032 [Champsocephalus esox]